MFEWGDKVYIYWKYDYIVDVIMSIPHPTHPVIRLGYRKMTILTQNILGFIPDDI